MFRIFVRHSVKDFDEWHRGYKKYYDIQRDLRMVGDSVQRGVEDPTEVTVVHESADQEDVKKYMSLPNLKELMDDIGVVGEPEIWVTEKVL